MWVLNVGDIKPGELCTQFFMELARDPEKFRNFDQLAYLKDWAGKTFGAQFADSIGSILDRYYRLNHPVKPEHLNITSSGFSHVKNGDEAERRLQDFEALARDADVLESQIPAELRAAYFELVLYPVRGTNLMNRKVLLAERSRLFAQQKRKSTVTTRNAAVQAYNQIGTETTYYNTSIAGGKWNWMMHWHPRDQSVFNMPTTGSYNPPADGPLGASVEGSARALIRATPWRFRHSARLRTASASSMSSAPAMPPDHGPRRRVCHGSLFRKPPARRRRIRECSWALIGPRLRAGFR